MKLLSLTLTNFKGIKSLTLDTQGGNVSVFGDNSTGKTTIFDSITWLLFGKDSQNKKDFEIKTLTADGQHIHNLDHEVEAVFDLNGKRLTLKKRFAEKWTQRRGSVTKEFSGHTTDHFVDGVPVSAGDYAGKIASICDEETFKLLTSPTYFNTQLHWQKRRDILLDVCGDVSDADVLDSMATLQNKQEIMDLTCILNIRTLDDHKKVIAGQRKKINDELEKIPVRIDEAERGLPDVTGIMQGHVISEKAQLTSKLEAKQAEISRIKNGGEVAEKTKLLRELESELLDIKNKHRASVDEAVQGKRASLSKIKCAVDDAWRKVKAGERQHESNLTAIRDWNKEAGSLREQWHEVNDREFTFEQDENCPACGQALPEEKLAEAREKAEAVFNRQKAGLLEEISTKGKQCKARIETLTVEDEAMVAEIKDAQAEMQTAEASISNLEAEIEKITTSATDPTASPAYKKAAKKITTIEAEIDALRTGDRELLTMAEGEAETLREQIQAVDDDLRKFHNREQGEARIKDLAAEQKKLAAEFEKLEKELYLTEEFIKAKVGLLEGKINGKFKHARFKLFSQNINGGIEPCCETLYSGVPYSSGLNSGHRGIVGLDIIATLAERYDFYPPIIYDNAESVTRLPKMQSQMICLYVSEKDKQLRVETEEQKTLFEGEM